MSLALPKLNLLAVPGGKSQIFDTKTPGERSADKKHVSRSGKLFLARGSHRDLEVSEAKLTRKGTLEKMPELSTHKAPGSENPGLSTDAPQNRALLRKKSALFIGANNHTMGYIPPIKTPVNQAAKTTADVPGTIQ